MPMQTFTSPTRRRRLVTPYGAKERAGDAAAYAPARGKEREVSMHTRFYPTPASGGAT